ATAGNPSRSLDRKAEPNQSLHRQLSLIIDGGLPMKSLSAALLIAVCAPLAAAPPPSKISTARLSEITRTLASDEFQGRSMGTAGEERTVNYLIGEFKAAGLEPGGENGGWTQTVPMIRTRLGSSRFSVRQGPTETTLRFPDDIY